MEEERQLSQGSNIGGIVRDQDDSFYVQEANDNEDDKKSSEPQQSKHKETKSKKKGIAKKKQKQSKSIKKPQFGKEKQKQMKKYQQAEKKAEEIIAKMKEFYDLDAILIQQKKMACKKLGYLQDLSLSLKNLYICQKFVQKDGLNILQRWLDKIIIHDAAIQPSVSLRKGVMEILLNMTIGADNISKISEIQRLVARQKRSQIKQLRDLSQKIILKWNQLAYEQN